MLASLLLTCLAAAAAAEGPTLAVLRVPARADLTADTADLLTGALTSAVRAQKRFSRVVGSREMETVLSLEQQRQMMDCSAENCMAELAGALGVDFVLSVSVGRLGDAWLINMTLINARNAEVAGALSRTVEGRGAQLVAETFDPMLERLLDDAGIAFLDRASAVAAGGPPRSVTPVQPRKEVYVREDNDEQAPGEQGPTGWRPWHVGGAITAACALPVPVCLLGSFLACLSVPGSEALRLIVYNQQGQPDPLSPVNQVFLGWTFLLGPVVTGLLLLPVLPLALGGCLGGATTTALFFLDRTLWEASEGLAEKTHVKKYRKRRCRGAECEERRGVE